MLGYNLYADCVATAACTIPSGSAKLRACAAQIEGAGADDNNSTLTLVAWCGMDAQSASYNCGMKGAQSGNGDCGTTPRPPSE